MVFANMDPLPIPVVAMSVALPTELGLIDPKTLKPNNPNWTTSFDPSVKDKVLRLLLDISKSNKITLICPSWACEKNSDIRGALINFLSQLGEKIQILAVTTDNFAEKISTLEQTFAFVSKLQGFNENQMIALYKAFGLGLMKIWIPPWVQAEGLRGFRLF